MPKLLALDYGTVRDDELAPLNALLEQALTFSLGSMARWTESIGNQHLRAVRLAGRPVAGLSMIQMGHFFGGQSVPAGGVTAVGVAPDQRGTGVGLWMMQQAVLEMQRQGLPLATLYPATTTFYRRTGFERAAQRIIYELPAAAIGIRDYALEARPTSPDDHATIKRLYAEYAARNSSFIDRPDFYWDSILTGRDKPSYCFLALRDGAPEGYVIFNHASWNEPLQVRDLVALTPAAGRRLLTLLADHRSMIETVRLPGSPNDPLLFLLPEQRQKVSWTLDLMIRILDVPAALSARGYPGAPAAELHLAVADDLLPSNDGRFVLRVADGRGAAEPGGQGLLRLDVRALAMLYSGYFSPHELHALDLLAGPPEAINSAALVFAGPRPWLPDMF